MDGAARCANYSHCRALDSGLMFNLFAFRAASASATGIDLSVRPDLHIGHMLDGGNQHSQCQVHMQRRRGDGRQILLGVSGQVLWLRPTHGRFMHAAESLDHSCQ